MIIYGLKDVCKNKNCIGNCLKGHVFYENKLKVQNEIHKIIYLYSEMKKTFLKSYF